MVTEIDVINPHTGARVGAAPRTGVGEVARILTRARVGAALSRRLPRHRRAAILESTAAFVDGERENFARLITDETGKPIRQARTEAGRCVRTLKLAAQVAGQDAGELIAFDAYEGSENRRGWFTREALGIITAITPYNDPLNLVAHKLGPALAGGNAVILKPSELALLSALRLVDALVGSGLPAEVVTVVLGTAEVAEKVVTARDVRVVSFTGGFRTGERIARTAGLKKLTMELGGNAPVIVMPDGDLADAVARCVSAAFSAAGQNCVSTQRILVHRTVLDRFRAAFLAATRAPRGRRPRRPCHRRRTDDHPGSCAPRRGTGQPGNRGRSAAAARQCTHRLAVPADGPGGRAHEPRGVDRGTLFAPVVIPTGFDDFDEAVSLANQGEYSLHTGIFTADLGLALRAADLHDASAAMIN